MKLQILFISLLHVISINYSLCQILTNKKLIISGGGNNIRAYIYISDAIKMLLNILFLILMINKLNRIYKKFSYPD